LSPCPLVSPASPAPPAPSPFRWDEAGGIRIGQSRVTLDSLLATYYNGSTPEEIAVQYPVLCLGEIYAAIAYYLTHRQEIDNYLEQRRKKAQHDFEIPQHDFEVPQHDFEVPQHDFEVPQHDFEVPQHDFEVPQHDFEVPQHDFEVPQHDFEVPQHDFEVPQHDFEVSVAYLMLLF
jgi:uncharacterized protein (DUF433 family)